MKIRNRVCLMVILSSFSVASIRAARAASFADKCTDISSCAKVVAELTGQKYLFDADVKGKVFATPNLELTTENAEVLFTNALNMNGFSRVPVGGSTPNTFQIMRQRDARDQAIPVVSASQLAAPSLPENWDLYTMNYKATNIEIVEDMARTVRSFMPANSRIIPEGVSGRLLVTDTAPNLKKVYGLLKGMDQKMDPSVRKRFLEREMEWRKRRNEAKQPEKSGG